MTQPRSAVCLSELGHGNGNFKENSHIGKKGCRGNSEEHINGEECSQEKGIYRGGRKN